jgi:YD repeat-containing protein
MSGLIRCLAAAIAIFAAMLAFATVASAQTMNDRAPRWKYTLPPVASLYSENGFGSCTEAGEAGLAHARLIHPQGIEVLRVSCAPSNPIFWSYRLLTDFPTTPSRDITLNVYCDAGGSASNPTQGFYCAGDFFSPIATKSVGKCPDCERAQGNPIFPGFGNKYLLEVDYAGAGPFPLRFERTYNSGGNLNKLIKTSLRSGTNWWHPYYRRLFPAVPNSGSIVIVDAERPDGRTMAFNLVGSVYKSDIDDADRLEKVAAGWKYTTTEDEVELYDDGGTLQSITNRAGLTQSLAYFTTGSYSGFLRQVTDPFGRTLTFEYNTDRHISAVVDPEGGRYTYGYSLNGSTFNLVSVTYPDNTIRRYHYESLAVEQQLHGITDELNVRFATYAYDSQARGTLSQHAGGAGKVTLFYYGDALTDVATWMSDVTTATRTYSYKRNGGALRNTGITGPACSSCGPALQAYNTNLNVIQRQDWNGNRTNYGYDLARNLETSRVEGLTAAGAATPQTRTITTEWHPTFRLVKRMAEPLRITSYVYNGDGGVTCGTTGALCSKTVQATTDAAGAAGFGAALTGTPRTWSYTYNANGQVLSMDGPRTDVADVTTYTYYANDDADMNKRGNVATIANAAGQATQITAYNAHGKLLTIVDPNGLTTTLAYDLRQRLTSRTVGGELTTYTYDNAGQLTKVTLPDGSFLSYSYDAAHRLTGIQDNLSNRVAYTLDFGGNRTREEVFDPANALAQTRSRVYSSINRLFQELGAASQTTEYGYDLQGNVTSVKDPLNRITANQYDPLNRLKQVTDPGTGVTLYGYNGLDALTQVTDPRSLVTGYTVDGLGNLTQQASPDTGNTVNTYDLAGNLLTQTDAKSQVTAYAYDALNRVTLSTFHDSSRQAYAYDQGTNGVGRLSSITETNPASQVTSLIAYAYDQKGRVTSETRTVNGVAYVLTYAYDSSGRLTGLTYPSGRTVTYAFDALGRVNQMTTTKDSQSLVAVQNVQYHPFGGAKSWTLGNGQIYGRTVDQDGRIASYSLGSASYTVGFDAASRITGIAQVGNPANANTYGYDTLDRLSSAVLPASNFSYSYDAVGNRLTKTIGANTDTYTYGSTSNRIASLTPSGSPPRSFVLDANGSTTNDSLNTYTYDTRGRMVQAVSTAGTTGYQVNALGQRVRKSNGSGDTVFTYDTWGKLIAESDPGGGVKRELIYLGDVPVMVWQ